MWPIRFAQRLRAALRSAGSGSVAARARCVWHVRRSRTFHSFESGVEIIYIPASRLSTFGITIEEVTEGEVGAAFPAQVDVIVDDSRWATSPDACAVDVEEHALELTEDSAIGEMRHYRIAGKGACPIPALPSSAEATGEVTIGSFRFAGSAVWRD